MQQANESAFYKNQVLRIREQYYPGFYLCRLIARARHFIDDNYCNDIGLQTICEFSCLSKFHFIRLFKRCYGRTPHQYLTEKRIERAKHLLYSNLSVVETCYRVGYQSPNSFSAVFKKHTGTSPSAYQKKQFSIRLCHTNAPILLTIKQNRDEN